MYYFQDSHLPYFLGQPVMLSVLKEESNCVPFSVFLALLELPSPRSTPSVLERLPCVKELVSSPLQPWVLYWKMVVHLKGEVSYTLQR